MPPRKRRRRRRRRRNNTRVIVQQGEIQYTPIRQSILRFKGVGLPDQYFTKLQWAETYNLTSVGSIASQIFRGNSLYDPDYTGVGTQPYYFDQLAGLYKKYIVYASKIQVTFVQGTGSGGGAFCTVYLVPKPTDVALPTSADEETQLPRCKSAQMGPNTGGDGVIKISHYGKSATIIGRLLSSDDVLSANTTSNPTQQFYWHIGVQSMDETTTPNIYAKVTITYYCKFFDRDYPGAS